MSIDLSYRQVMILSSKSSSENVRNNDKKNLKISKQKSMRQCHCSLSSNFYKQSSFQLNNISDHKMK